MIAVMSLRRSLALHAPLYIALVVTGLIAALAPIGGDELNRLAIGWDVGAAVFVGATLYRMARAEGADAIRRRAAALDQTGRLILPLSLPDIHTHQLVIALAKFVSGRVEIFEHF